MSNLVIQNHKALVSRLYTLLNAHDFATAATLVVSRNTDNCAAYWRDVQKTFPDFNFLILDVFAEREAVVVNSLFSGTHQGVATLPHHGSLLVNAKATGRTVSVPQVHVYHVVTGKLIELYAVRDDLSLYQQLRLLPQQKQELVPEDENFAFLAG